MRKISNNSKSVGNEPSSVEEHSSFLHTGVPKYAPVLRILGWRGFFHDNLRD
jgi:hypothetical protein